MSKRVHVTVPDDVAELLEWYVKHDPRFEHQAGTAAAHFLAEGLKAAYQRGLAEAEPIEPDDPQLREFMTTDLGPAIKAAGSAVMIRPKHKPVSVFVGSSLDDYLAEQLKKPGFRKAFDARNKKLKGKRKPVTRARALRKPKR